MKLLITLLCVTSSLQLFGIYSEFVNITPSDLRKHPEHSVYVEPITNSKGKYRFFIPYVDDSQTYWLVVCKNSRSKEDREFRKGVVLSPILPDDIELVVMLHPELIKHPNDPPYISLEITEDIAKRAYVYKDYPYFVDDGGKYYCYDLISFVEAYNKQKHLDLTVREGLKTVPIKQAPSSLTKAVSKLHIGAKRKGVESILKEEWEICGSYEWESAQNVFYRHKKLKDYFLSVVYNWKGISAENQKQARLRYRSSDDQEITESVEIKLYQKNKN